MYNITNAGRINENSEDYIAGVLESNLEEFDLGVAEFTLSDKETLLLGQEAIVCQHTTMPSLFAYAFRDIYDKKVAQKILRFFVFGFPRPEKIFRDFIVVPKKNYRTVLNLLFAPEESNNELTQRIEHVILQKSVALTYAQRTCEWFTLRAFHVTATMAARIVSSSTMLDTITIYEMLVSSWFSRNRSTPEMVTGTKNESAILYALLHNRFIEAIYECGLFESKCHPWLAASPDAIALIHSSNGRRLAVVEIKTRVSHERIAKAEEIAEKHNNKVIMCTIDDDDWKEVIEKDHQAQLLVQMAVLEFQHCVYVVGQAGTRGVSGRIIYTVIARAPEGVVDQFTALLTNTFEPLLSPFFANSNISQVLQQLPKELSDDVKRIIETRWILFNNMRQYKLRHSDLGFPATSVLKTKVQMIYNALKGGLDANTQNIVQFVHPSRLLLNRSMSFVYYWQLWVTRGEHFSYWVTEIG